jgi:hypothetical protein
MSTSHTPGPWHVSNPNGGANEIADRTGMIVASTHVPRNGQHPEMHANARLIAAVTDLLAALIDIRDSSAYDAAAKARAAMAIEDVGVQS